MSDIFKAMKAKKKRAVDPNAPPRPNLMTHDVKLRTAEQTIQDQANTINILQIRLENLERKVRAQADYLSQLHQRISRG
jgi:predicted RNase H-like nuclease (RuvC/YqgF family)